MGTNMRGHLEYRRSARWYRMDDGWDLVRDYRMYRLLADFGGEGALYPSRGVPQDAGRNVRRAYYCPVYNGDAVPAEGPLQSCVAFTRAEADHYVAHGLSVRAHRSLAHYISNPEFYSASWLTTAEFRQVVDFYEAHGHEFLEEERAWHLRHPASSAEGEAYQRKVVARLLVALRGGGRPHAVWRTMLAAMEMVESRGYPVRLIYWFTGLRPPAFPPSVAVVGVTKSSATRVAGSS